jgi:hypothetical protein
MDRMIFEINDSGVVLNFKEHYNGLFIGIGDKNN